MTSVAWQRGFKNAIICSIGVFGAVGILTYGISTLTGRTLRDAGAIAFAASWIAIFAIFVSTFLIGRANRGAILLDCGHHPTRALFLFNATIFAFLGLSGGFASSTFDTHRITAAIFGIASSAYWVLISIGRLQIVENGIWQYWSLLKWQKVESYEWRGDTSPTLMLQTKTTLPFLGRGALPVPAEHKEAVSVLLQQHAAPQAA